MHLSFCSYSDRPPRMIPNSTVKFLGPEQMVNMNLASLTVTTNFHKASSLWLYFHWRSCRFFWFWLSVNTRACVDIAGCTVESTLTITVALAAGHTSIAVVTTLQVSIPAGADNGRVRHTTARFFSVSAHPAVHQRRWSLTDSVRILPIRWAVGHVPVRWPRLPKILFAFLFVFVIAPGHCQKVEAQKE
jgi:hypothetical protein